MLACGLMKQRVAMARGPIVGGVAAGGDPDRRMRPLHRLERQRRLREREVAARVGDHVLRPQPPRHREDLEETRHAGFHLDAQALELLGPVAEPHAEHEAPLGEDVQRRNLLGHVGRGVDGEQEDVRDEAHLSRLGGQAAEQRKRLHHLERSQQVVVADRHRVEPRVARRPYLVDELAHLDARVLARQELCVQDQSELHRRRHHSAASSRLPAVTVRMSIPAPVVRLRSSFDDHDDPHHEEDNREVRVPRLHRREEVGRPLQGTAERHDARVLRLRRRAPGERAFSWPARPFRAGEPPGRSGGTAARSWSRTVPSSKRRSFSADCWSWRPGT